MSPSRPSQSLRTCHPVAITTRQISETGGHVDVFLVVERRFARQQHYKRCGSQPSVEQALIQRRLRCLATQQLAAAIAAPATVMALQEGRQLAVCQRGPKGFLTEDSLVPEVRQPVVWTIALAPCCRIKWCRIWVIHTDSRCAKGSLVAATLADSRISLLSPLVASSVPCETSGGVSTETDSQWERILSDLVRLRDLEDDWDGQGSLPPDRNNVDAARCWINDMRGWHQALPPRSVFPGTAGEVVLEWRGDAFQLAAEISTPEKVEWLLNVPGQPVRQWETDLRCTWIVRSERGVPTAGSDAP